MLGARLAVANSFLFGRRSAIATGGLADDDGQDRNPEKGRRRGRAGNGLAPLACLRPDSD